MCDPFPRGAIRNNTMYSVTQHSMGQSVSRTNAASVGKTGSETLFEAPIFHDSCYRYNNSRGLLGRVVKKKQTVRGRDKNIGGLGTDTHNFANAQILAMYYIQPRKMKSLQTKQLQSVTLSSHYYDHIVK